MKSASVRDGWYLEMRQRIIQKAAGCDLPGFIALSPETKLASAQFRAEALSKTGWAPVWERPGRDMPTLWQIAVYWEPMGLFGVDLDVPQCFGCYREVPRRDGLSQRMAWECSGRYLERAHLVNRVRDGLDGPQNLVPLCHLCHSLMTIFNAHSSPSALDWVLEGGAFQYLLSDYPGGPPRGWPPVPG